MPQIFDYDSSLLLYYTLNIHLFCNAWIKPKVSVGKANALLLSYVPYQKLFKNNKNEKLKITLHTGKQWPVILAKYIHAIMYFAVIIVLVTP